MAKTASRTGPGKQTLTDMGDGWIPPGYSAVGYGRRLSSPLEACFWIVYRPDGTPVGEALGEDEEIEDVAWDDHRRRILHLVSDARGDR